MRVLISGSRKYPDLELVKQFVKTLPYDTILLNGCSEGVENVARNQALFQDLIVLDYHPDNDKYGINEAWKIRNHHLVDLADEVHLFWDGKSEGTRDTIEYATQYGKLVNLIIDRGEDV